MVMWIWLADTLFWQLSIDHNMDVYHQVKHRYRFPQWLKSLTFPEAHNPESATFILGLCHGVFTDRFSFRCILQHFLPRKRKLLSVHELVINIRGDKGKPNVIKGSKMPFLGVLVLMTCFWDLKDILNSHQNRSKNKLVIENAATRVHGNCSLPIMGSWHFTLVALWYRRTGGRTDGHVITKISRMDWLPNSLRCGVTLARTSPAHGAPLRNVKLL